MIGELFTRGYVKDDVAKKCFEFLTSEQEEIVDEVKIESLCFFLERVAKFVIKNSSRKEGSITLDYIDQILINLIEKSKDP